MKSICYQSVVMALGVMVSIGELNAGEAVIGAVGGEACEIGRHADHVDHAYNGSHDHNRASVNAPAGVMYDHLHAEGGFMVGYRYLYSRQKGLLEGSRGITFDEVAGHGFRAVGSGMEMHMHMLDVMYAPVDWLTLMVMPHYMVMDMEMKSLSGGHGGHGHGGHGGRGGHGGTHTHGVEGWGDTAVVALFPLLEWGEGHVVHGGLGVSVPTGSVTEEGMDGRLTHYSMQLGSGTWDVLPSLTYRGRVGDYSWGAQYAANVGLESENESGFRFGDLHAVTVWGAWDASECVSLSLRGLYSREGSLRGHYNAAHNHSTPHDIQANHGGERIDIGIGVNAVLPSGVLDSHRLGVEVLVPVWEDVRGIQLEQKLAVALTWSLYF